MHVLTGAQRDQIVEDVVIRLNENNGWEALGKLRKKIFNSPNAPVSYPFCGIPLGMTMYNGTGLPRIPV